VAETKRHQDRRCVASGEAIGPDETGLRFVLDPEGRLTFDEKAQLPGRGAWLRPERAALLLALKRGGFKRSFRRDVRLPGDDDAEGFAERVASTLRDAALARLGLCRKAGSLATGRDTVREAGGKALAYLTPADGSGPEVEKVARYLHKAHGVPHVTLPAGRDAIGRAIGQDAVHLALLAGGPSKGALTSVLLWDAFSR
jgi:predicted RNA-binding protein YlxR (DUF448 family)